MKNLAIMGCLVVGLLLISSVSGSAQVSSRYNAHIPFDFTVGKKLLKAGDYTIGPAGGTTNQRASLLKDDSTGNTRVLGVIVLGVRQADDQHSMNFVNSGSGWALQTIETEAFSLNFGRIRLKSADINVATAKKPAETQTILLQN